MRYRLRTSLFGFCSLGKAAAPAVLAAVVALGGCGASSSTLSGDNTADLMNAKYRWQLRAEAMNNLWNETLGDKDAHERTRSLLKDIVWDTTGGIPNELRIHAMEKLLSDPDPEDLADSRAMARLMMPKEPSRAMMVYLCSVVGARGWEDFTGPLIRSYSRFQLLVPDKERAERTALVTLYPGKKVEQVVYDAFVTPPPMDKIPGLDTTQRLRAEAWDLLGRLDPSGSFRLRALRETGVPENDVELAAIQRAAREVRAIPISGGEIAWLTSLVNPDNAANAAWWAEVSSITARLSDEQALGLCLRHLEALRYASVSKPSWLSMSRQALMKELEVRLADRTFHRRGADQQSNHKPVRQDLSTWRDRLSWGDLVSILAVDDVLADARIRTQLFRQQALDHADKQTEYGGILEFLSPSTVETTWSGEAKDQAPRWQAQLYTPRSAQRVADDRFIASDDMMNAADRALAIYHFHTHSYRNEDYAGPSDADTDFATTTGRTCLVFTSIREDRMNIDYYLPGGPILDLGDMDKK
ncbi:MAG: hypothetical protein AMXMBFR58_04950 [Phycisphaerae bacterium]